MSGVSKNYEGIIQKLWVESQQQLIGYNTDIWPFCTQVREAEALIKHKLFPPNAWMKVLNFNVLTSCPKDELHQWFIVLYGEHVIPAIVHKYTKILQRPDLITLDKDGN